MTHKTKFFILIFLFLQTSFLFSQETKLTRYMTTQENSFWMDMIDRATVSTFKPGVIHDYDTRMDNEYWIDFNSYNFSILDDSNYVESKNGFRALSGSINSSRFFVEGGLKTYYQMNDSMFFKVDYAREDNYSSEHDALLLSIGREIIKDQKLNIYLQTSLETDKEDLDFNLGVSWEPIANLKLDLQLVALDFMNNLMSEAITRHQQPEKRVFDKQPYATRLRTSYEWNNYRIELFAATDTPEKSNITYEDTTFTDYTEEIRYAYFGGKIEKQWRDNFTTGIFGSVRTATHNRIGRDENNFRIDESHSQIGAYALYRLNDRWRFETEASYTSYQTKKGPSTDTSLDLDTDDWGVEAKTSMFVRLKTRLELQSSLLLDRRVMTTLLEKYPLSGTNVRWSWGFRYQMKESVYLMFTNNIGLENFPAYDGSSLQMQILW